MKSTFEDPWLNCGRCGKKYYGSTEKLLADEFFKCYMATEYNDVRTYITIFAMVKSEFSALDKDGNKSDQSYKKMQVLQEVLKRSGKCRATKEDDLFKHFQTEIEKDANHCLVVAEFYLPKKIPKTPDACCWICLDDKPEENGEPLVRTCACRGGGGYCHFNCIYKYAEQKNEGIV